MSKEEIALQLTLKAIDANYVKYKEEKEAKTKEEISTLNANIVADFYNAIYSKISVDQAKQ